MIISTQRAATAAAATAAEEAATAAEEAAAAKALFHDSDHITLSRDLQWAINHIHSYIHSYIMKIKYTRQNNVKIK